MEICVLAATLRGIWRLCLICSFERDMEISVLPASLRGRLVICSFKRDMKIGILSAALRGIWRLVASRGIEDWCLVCSFKRDMCFSCRFERDMEISLICSFKRDVKIGILSAALRGIWRLVSYLQL